MRINFNDIELSELKNYKDGKGEVFSKIVLEGNKKIMIHKVKSGCSIGVHAHENCTEFIYILDGEPTIIEDEGYTFKASKNEVLIYKPGQGHGMKNESDKDVDLLVVVYK